MPRNLSVRLGDVTQLPVSRNALYSAIDSELRAERVSVSRATPWMGPALGAAFGAALLLPNAASAATITVNSPAWTIADDGNCTMPEAVEAANTNAAVDNCAAGALGLDEIRFDGSLSGSTITVSSTLNVPTDEALDIAGPTTDSADLVFDGNNTYQFINADADISVANLTARNFETGNSGGAIYSSASVSADNSRFENNYAYSDGGAIMAYSVAVTNSQFVNNEAYDDGGAIDAYSVTATGSRFENNWAYDDGGAVNADMVTATSSQFVNNQSESIGGAIDGYLVSAAGSLFEGNQAYRYGGAIAADNVQISATSTFTGNSARRAGGAVFSELGGSISDSSFSYNSAQAGGAVFVGYADGLYLGGLGPQRQSGDKARKRVLGQPGYLVDISISGSQFTRNTAARSTYGPGQTLGGAIAIAPKYETLGGGEHQVTLSGSQLIENAVTTAVPLRPADNTTDSKLAPGPIAYSFGGGLAVLHSGSGAENRPDGQGAREQLGVPLPTTINVDIDGSTFDNNLAPAGGGAAVFASTITVDGSDFTGNGAYFAGGGIFSGTRPKYGPPNPVATDATSLSFGETSFDGNLAAAFAGVVGFAGSVSGDGLDLLNNQTAQHPGFDPLRPASAKAGAWFANQTSPGKGTPVACSLGGGSGKYGIGGGGVLASTSSTSLSGGSQVSGNCAAYAAGGVVLVGGKYGGIDGTVTVAADSVVSNNQASISAPGMVVSAGPSSKYGGSGGAASGSSASISGSFTGNTASLSAYGTGGGLALALKYGASASVSQASISGNQAAQGGGVSAAAYSGPSATVTLTSNLVVSDSTISGNNAVVGGGVNLAGVVASSGTPGLGNSELRLSGIADKLQRMGVRTPRLDSVIERRFGNTAKSTKGAVQPLVALLQNVTVDSNTTNPAGGTATISEQGGGLLANNVDLTMDHVTITGNSTGGQGGGVQLAGPAATTIDNSIIALNSDDGSAPDLGGSADINFSLVQDVTGATLNGANNLTGVDPMLDPLADNGGPTLTRLPQIGSPVVNAGDPAFNIGLLPNDQRGAGFPRDAGGGTDMGAVEGITPREVISIDIAPNPFAEGTSATMTVTLDGNTQVDTLVTVDFSGTAALGTDFGSGDADGGTAGIQVQVLAGSSSGSVQLDATADSLHEGDEPFTATVSAADFATIPLTPPSFAATITDGDALTFSIADASGAENIGNLDFTVSLNVPSTQAVSVTAMTANGTALAGADYTAVSTTVNFPAGSTSQAVSVPIIDDAVAESAETFAVNLSNPSTGSIADANATGTIIDDESAPTVSLSLTPPSNTEGGGSFMVTANLSGPSGEDVVVTLNFGGTASFGTDYTVTDQDPGTPGIQIIIPAGSTSASVTVSPLVDNENEPDETIIVSIGSASGAGAAGAPGTGTIVNGTAGPLPAAPPELIPTLNEWMLMLLGLLLPAAVMVKLRGGRRDDKLKA